MYILSLAGHGYKMLGNSSILDDNLMSTSESLLPQTPINNSSAILKEGFTLSYDRNSFQNDGFGDEGAACMLGMFHVILDIF